VAGETLSRGRTPVNRQGVESGTAAPRAAAEEDPEVGLVE